LKIYTSTKKIPGLENMSLPERMAILENASRKMTVPEKTLLNVIKLLVIVPVFALLLRVVESWWSLAWAGLILLLYPMFVKPLQYSMSVKYLDPLLQGDDERGGDVGGGSPFQGNDGGGDDERGPRVHGDDGDGERDDEHKKGDDK
jgi:hypothetical protein